MSQLWQSNKQTHRNSEGLSSIGGDVMTTVSENYKLEQENKRLKEELDVMKTVNLKLNHDGEELHNLKQKLEKIEEWRVGLHNHDITKLKEILEEKA